MEVGLASGGRKKKTSWFNSGPITREKSKREKDSALKGGRGWEQGAGMAAGRRAGSFGKADDSC